MKWIETKNLLPPENVSLLIYHKREYELAFFSEGRFWASDDEDYEFYTPSVTHWALLAPPQNSVEEFNDFIAKKHSQRP